MFFFPSACSVTCLISLSAFALPREELSLETEAGLENVVRSIRHRCMQSLLIHLKAKIAHAFLIGWLFVAFSAGSVFMASLGFSFCLI